MATVMLADLVGKYIRLPATFWGDGYAKKTYPSDWFDVCKITKHFPNKSGYHESLEFQFSDGAKYSMTGKEARSFHAKGVFQGKCVLCLARSLTA